MLAPAKGEVPDSFFAGSQNPKNPTKESNKYRDLKSKRLACGAIGVCIASKSRDASASLAGSASAVLVKSNNQSNDKLASSKSSSGVMLACKGVCTFDVSPALLCASHSAFCAEQSKPQPDSAAAGSIVKSADTGTCTQAMFGVGVNYEDHQTLPAKDSCLMQEDGQLVTCVDCPIPAVAESQPLADVNGETTAILIDRANQFLDGLCALPSPLLPEVTSVRLPKPEPLYPLPSVTAKGLNGGCTEHPGYQFDLQRMRQLGIEEPLLMQLRDGVRFGFTSDPPMYYHGNHGSTSTPAAKRIVHDDLLRLYDLGKLSDCGVDRPFVVNPLGLVLKPNKVRVVVDASISGINDLMDLIYFPLPTAISAVKLMTKGCYMAKLDVSDAYLSILVHPEERKFLGVECPLTGRYFTYDYCPFGARNSGPIFCEAIASIVEAVRREWKRHGIEARICNYSDDCLILADTEAMCSAALSVAYHTFTEIGMKIKASKLVYLTQVIEFVGVLFDSVQGQMGVTEERRKVLISAIESLLAYGKGTYEDWDRLVGRLTFISEAVPGLGGALQPLHRLLPVRKQHRLARVRQRQVCVDMTRAARNALLWVLSRLQGRLYRTLHVADDQSFYTWTRSFGMSESRLVPLSQATLVMDASGEHGWGVSWIEAGESRAGRWSAGWQTAHINPKELYCCLVSLRWWASTWQRLGIRRVLAFSDNTPTVGCLNKLRSARPGMDSICQRIRELLCQFGIELVSVHRPGVDNVLADGLSRGTVAPCTSELSLSRLGLRSMLAHTNTRRSQRHYQELVPVTHSFKQRGLPAFAAGGVLPEFTASSSRLVGIIPRVAAVQLLKAVLLCKRADPQLSCAFLVPYRHRFNERWGSFHRYYRRLSPRVAARGSVSWAVQRALHEDLAAAPSLQPAVLREAHIVVGF